MVILPEYNPQEKTSDLVKPKKTADARVLHVIKEDGESKNDITLVNGSTKKLVDIFAIASIFLGNGYTEPDKANHRGRFVSADGKRVFRMGENDLLGRHGGGPHVNFELLEPNPKKPGKMYVAKENDFHIYLEEDKVFILEFLNQISTTEDTSFQKYSQLYSKVYSQLIAGKKED